jgi:hypothetical protein
LLECDTDEVAAAALDDVDKELNGERSPGEDSYVSLYEESDAGDKARQDFLEESEPTSGSDESVSRDSRTATSDGPDTVH